MLCDGNDVEAHDDAATLSKARTLRGDDSTRYDSGGSRTSTKGPSGDTHADGDDDLQASDSISNVCLSPRRLQAHDTASLKPDPKTSAVTVTTNSDVFGSSADSSDAAGRTSPTRPRPIPKAKGGEKTSDGKRKRRTQMEKLLDEAVAVKDLEDMFSLELALP